MQYPDGTTIGSASRVQPEQETQPIKQVLEHLERFDRCQVRTKELLDRLEASLTGVLRPEAPCETNQSEPKESLVPVATMIERYTDTQAMLNRQVESLIHRLEV